MALNPPLLIYNGALILLSPFFLASKLYSRLSNGPPKNYDLVRWFGGKYRCRRKLAGSIRIVYMCASYGEAVLASALHEELARQRLPVEAVFTIRNRAELERFGSSFDEQVLLYPFDFWIPFALWHRRAQPDIVVFVEKFFFGNVAIGSKARGARVVAINARANVRRKPIRKLISFHYPAIVRSFDWIGARSMEHAERIREMAPDARCVESSGNFKSGMPIKALPEDQLSSLGDWAKSARYPEALFVAGSLDSAEEIDFVLEAFRLLREKGNGSLMVAPRQISDAEMVKSKAAAMGYSYSFRTDPEPGADVLVLDTLGELAHAYRFGVGAFIGGTITGAGHNVIEPLHWGVPVSYGPVRGHFEDLQVLCETSGIGFRFDEPAQLAEHWERLAADPGHREALRSSIGKVLAQERRGYEATVAKMKKLVFEVAAPREAVVLSHTGS